MEAEINKIRENVIPRMNIGVLTSDKKIHEVGTERYYKRKADLEAKGQFGPSYITISEERVLEVVKKYSGTGELKIDKNGKWTNEEIIKDNDEIVGVVVNNLNGKTAQTTVFKIHYSKNGVHIVPDYPSKKGSGK